MAWKEKELTIDPKKLTCLLTTSGQGDTFTALVPKAAFDAWADSEDHYAMMEKVPEGDKIEFVGVIDMVKFVVKHGIKLTQEAEGGVY